MLYLRGLVHRFWRRWVVLVLVATLGLSPAFSQQDSLVPPTITGVIRAKFEHNFDRDSGRYEIRNARVQFTGPVGRFFEYKLELDMLDEDKITYHDMFIRLRLHKSFSVTIGQMKTPYSRDYLRGPSSQFFSNRSFAAKQMASNMRDVGFKADFSQKGPLPFTLTWGMFDGSGTSNPDYVKKYKYFLGAVINPWTGVEFSANAQKGNFLVNNVTETYRDMRMISSGIHFKRGPWLLEVEYMEKTIEDTVNLTTNAFLLQANYQWALKEYAIRHIIPAIRLDFYNKDMNVTDFSPGRLTIGATFGLARLTYADIRINYENYFYQPEVSPLPLSMMNDKITIEFTARF